MVRMMPDVQNGIAQSKKRTGAGHGVADVEYQEPGDVEAEEQGDCPDDDGEFQRADVDAEGGGGGQQVFVIIQYEGGVDADSVVVEEADDKEQHGGGGEQDEQDQRERADLEPGDEPGLGGEAGAREMKARWRRAGPITLTLGASHLDLSRRSAGEVSQGL